MMFQSRTILPSHEKTEKKISRCRLSHHEYHTVAKFLSEFCQDGYADGLSMDEIARAVTKKTSCKFSGVQVAKMRDKLGLEWVTKYQAAAIKKNNLVQKVDYLETKMIDITTSFNILEKRLNLLADEFNRM